MYRDSPCGLKVEAAPSGAGFGQIWPYTGISEQPYPVHFMEWTIHGSIRGATASPHGCF